MSPPRVEEGAPVQRSTSERFGEGLPVGAKVKATRLPTRASTVLRASDPDHESAPALVRPDLRSPAARTARASGSTSARWRRRLDTVEATIIACTV